jgi:hypothetical protein
MPSTRIHRIAGLTMIVLSLVIVQAAESAGQRYALLVGVGAYAELRKLEGPPNDVSAMKQALAAWGFDQITILQDAQATRAAILEKLDALAKEAEPGSQVLFYFSGHGTSPVDPKFGAALALPHTTGALLPYDARKSGDPAAIRRSLLIGREDLRPRFEALDRKGVHLTAWIDACFSENSTHSLAGLTARAESIPGFNPGSLGSGSGGYEAYPYKNAVTLAASAANQTAVDIDEKTIRQYPTRDGRAHGAFSDVLLRALNDRSLPGYGGLDRNGDGGVSVEELATGVTHFMASRQYGQEPKLQPMSAGDSNGTRNQPLFFADQRPQPTAPTPAPVKPDPTLPVAANLPEPQRRQAMLDRIVSAAQQPGRATVGLELASPYATSRLPIGDKDHCVKVDLAYKADQKGYPLVIDRFSDGGVQWLYPLAGADDRKQRSQWQQPLSAGQAIKLWSAQTTPPAGVDTLYTFLLDQPLPENVVTGSHAIKPNDGARFDLLLDALDKPGRVLGAHRLSLDIYEPKAGELKSWPEEKCK